MDQIPENSSVTFSYLKVLRQSPGPLLYGASHSFFSGLGQTFLIALFVPLIQKSTSLSHSRFGFYYGIATVTSALCLPYIGGLADRWQLQRLSVTAAITVGLGWLLLGADSGLLTLCCGLFLVRLGGQALMSHIASTGTARYFAAERGRALALTNLGYPLSEALLPAITIAILGAWAWQTAAWLLAGAAIILFVPIIFASLQSTHPYLHPHRMEMPGDTATLATGATRSQVLRHGYFYLMIPLFLAPPFLCTGLFFYQAQIAKLSGWPIHQLAAGFSSFAAMRVLASFACGATIDRFGAWRVAAFGLLPFIGGLAVLMTVTQGFGAWLYLGLLGLSTGWQSTIAAAALTEIYGTKHLGAIRGLLSPLMVAATAAATPLFGWYFDAVPNLEPLLGAAMVYLAVATVMASLATIKYGRGKDELEWNSREGKEAGPASLAS